MLVTLGRGLVAVWAAASRRRCWNTPTRHLTETPPPAHPPSAEAISDRARQLMSSLQPKAAAGDAEAQHQLAEMCFFGPFHHLPRDLPSALKWYAAAGHSGHLPSQLKLGCLYFRGLSDVPLDKPQAFAWYTRAAAQGSREGLFIAGTCLEEGEGTAVDLPQAVAYYERAAQAGHLPAQLKLGYLYYVGLPGGALAKDLRQSFEWYLKAAELNGSVHGMYLAGRCYEAGDGVPGNKKDPAKALQWFYKAAQQGDSEAQFRVGLAYLHGQPDSAVAKSLPTALRWLEQAAEQGHIEAMFVLSDVYRGQLQDEAQADRWLSEAQEEERGGRQQQLTPEQERLSRLYRSYG